MRVEAISVAEDASRLHFFVPLSIRGSANAIVDIEKQAVVIELQVTAPKSIADPLAELQSLSDELDTMLRRAQDSIDATRDASRKELVSFYREQGVLLIDAIRREAAAMSTAEQEAFLQILRANPRYEGQLSEPVDSNDIYQIAQELFRTSGRVVTGVLGVVAIIYGCGASKIACVTAVMIATAVLMDVIAGVARFDSAMRLPVAVDGSFTVTLPTAVIGASRSVPIDVQVAARTISREDLLSAKVPLRQAAEQVDRSVSQLNDGVTTLKVAVDSLPQHLRPLPLRVPTVEFPSVGRAAEVVPSELQVSASNPDLDASIIEGKLWVVNKSLELENTRLVFEYKSGDILLSSAVELLTVVPRQGFLKYDKSGYYWIFTQSVTSKRLYFRALSAPLGNDRNETIASVENYSGTGTYDLASGSNSGSLVSTGYIYYDLFNCSASTPGSSGALVSSSDVAPSEFAPGYIAGTVDITAVDSRQNVRTMNGGRFLILRN